MFDWLFGKKHKDLAVSKEKAEPRYIEGNGDFLLKVVGESHYQEALDEISGGKTEEGHQLIQTAIISPEPDNSYDPDAQKVTINHHLVGYIPRNIAGKVGQKYPHGVIVRALITGGWDRGYGDTGSYGVRLDLPL